MEFEDEDRGPPASSEVREAEAYLARGEVQPAVAILEARIASHPRDARAHLDLGLARELAGELGAAEAAYRGALEIDPDLPEALNNLGAVLRDAGRIDEAIAILERAVSARPRFAAAHLNLGLALEDGERLEEAERAYRVVIELVPRDPVSRTNVAMILLARGEREGAQALLREALEVARERADLAQIGNGLRRAGLADLAVQALRRAVEAEEEAPPPGLRAELALAEYAAGLRGEAEAHLRELIRDQPDYATARWVLGNLLAASERWAEAGEQYEAFLRIAPDAPEAEQARARRQHVQERARRR